MHKNFYMTKRGAVWYVRLRDPATGSILPQKSSGFGNKTRAESWAAERFAELSAKVASCQTPVREWADRFFKPGCPHVERLRDEGRLYAASTIRQNRLYVETDILKDPIADVRLGELTRNELLDFRTRVIARRGRTRSSQLAYGALRIIVREAVHRGLLDSDPSAGLRNLAYNARQRPALPLGSMQRLLDGKYWPDPVYWRPTLCAALTGMRSGEIRGLRWPNLDRAAGIIRIVDNLPRRSLVLAPPKWGKPRLTIYPSILQEVLEPLRKPEGYVFGDGDKPIDYDKWHGAIHAAGKAAEIPGVGIHSLRHSLQTHLRGRGVADDLIRGAFGWSNASVQDKYTHRELYDLAPLADAVELAIPKGYRTRRI